MWLVVPETSGTVCVLEDYGDGVRHNLSPRDVYRFLGLLPADHLVNKQNVTEFTKILKKVLQLDEDNQRVANNKLGFCWYFLQIFLEALCEFFPQNTVTTLSKMLEVFPRTFRGGSVPPVTSRSPAGCLLVISCMSQYSRPRSTRRSITSLWLPLRVLDTPDTIGTNRSCGRLPFINWRDSGRSGSVTYHPEV